MNIFRKYSILLTDDSIYPRFIQKCLYVYRTYLLLRAIGSGIATLLWVWTAIFSLDTIDFFTAPVASIVSLLIFFISVGCATITLIRLPYRIFEYSLDKKWDWLANQAGNISHELDNIIFLAEESQEYEIAFLFLREKQHWHYYDTIGISEIAQAIRDKRLPRDDTAAIDKITEEILTVYVSNLKDLLKSSKLDSKYLEFQKKLENYLEVFSRSLTECRRETDLVYRKK